MESFAGKTSNKVVFGVGNGDWVPTTRMVEVFPVSQGPGRVFDSPGPRRSTPTAGRHRPIRPRTDGLPRKSGSPSKETAAAAGHPGSLKLSEKDFQSIFYDPLDPTGVGSTFDHHLSGGPGTTESEAAGDIEFANSEWSPLKHLILGKHRLSLQSSPDLTRAVRERFMRNGERSKPKTPRTRTRLMQKHRDSERFRHRGLNTSIDNLLLRLPERSRMAKEETKIMKLKQIINYICHMENYIQVLCGELGLDLNFQQIFMSPNISSTQLSDISVPQTGVSLATRVYPWQKKYKKKGLKVLSSMQNSETVSGRRVESSRSGVNRGSSDPRETCTLPRPSMETQDQLKLHLTDHEWLLADNPLGIWFLLDEIPTQIQAEPEGKQDFPLEKPGQPDSMDTSSVLQSLPCAKKRAEYVFQTIDTNVLHSSSQDEARSSLDMMSKHHIDETSSQKFISKEQDKSAAEKIKKGKSTDKENKPLKGNMRSQKSSWLNAFLVFAQKHRGNYIRANVGLRNSKVTKLMANDWKRMDAIEKLPYREKERATTESQ